MKVKQWLIQYQLALIRLVSKICFNYKANNTVYQLQLPYKSCRACLSNYMRFISRHMTPLVITSYMGRGHTYTSLTRSISKNQMSTSCRLARAWFIKAVTDLSQTDLLQDNLYLKLLHAYCIIMCCMPVAELPQDKACTCHLLVLTEAIHSMDSLSIWL